MIKVHVEKLLETAEATSFARDIRIKQQTYEKVSPINRLFFEYEEELYVQIEKILENSQDYFLYRYKFPVRILVPLVISFGQKIRRMTLDGNSYFIKLDTLNIPHLLGIEQYEKGINTAFRNMIIYNQDFATRTFRDDNSGCAKKHASKLHTFLLIFNTIHTPTYVFQGNNLYPPLVRADFFFIRRLIDFNGDVILHRVALRIVGKSRKSITINSQNKIDEKVVEKHKTAQQMIDTKTLSFS